MITLAQRSRSAAGKARAHCALAAVQALDPRKDVDGLTTFSAGALVSVFMDAAAGKPLVPSSATIMIKLNKEANFFLPITFYPLLISSIAGKCVISCAAK